jgi:hypothetical protein
MQFLELWKLPNNGSVKFRLINDQVKFKHFHSLSVNDKKHNIDCNTDCIICDYYKELTKFDPLSNSPFRVITHAYINVEVDNESVVLVVNKRKYSQITKLITPDIPYFNQELKITKQMSTEGFNEYIIEFDGYNYNELPNQIDINIDESTYTRSEVMDLLINSNQYIPISKQ